MFDNNRDRQVIVVHLHDGDARLVNEHVKKKLGPKRPISSYLREWEMPDGSPRIQVSCGVAAGRRKWECKAQEVHRGHWEDNTLLDSLHTQSPWFSMAICRATR